jgi:hypothetical protein
VSIVRGRASTAGLSYLAEHHDPARVVFVDGWTGKGAITRELAAALAAHRGGFDPDLACWPTRAGACAPSAPGRTG